MELKIGNGWLAAKEVQIVNHSSSPKVTSLRLVRARSPHYLSQRGRERHYSDILILFGGLLIKQTFAHR
jgi:hypothetical protein